MLLSFGTEHERTPPKLSLARGSNELHLAVTAGFEPEFWPQHDGTTTTFPVIARLFD